MEMEVVDDLPSLRARIARQAVAPFTVARALREKPGHAHAMARHLLVTGLETRERFDMPLRDDQKMDGRPRVEVLEGETLVVLVFDLSRAFPGDDSAETQPPLTAGPPRVYSLSQPYAAGISHS